MKKQIQKIEIDPQVRQVVEELENSFQSPAERQRVKRVKAKQALRNGRRGVYDLDPEMIREVKKLADENGTTASQVAGLALHMFLQAVRDGDVILDLYKRRIEGNPRYRFLLRIDFGEEEDQAD